MIGVHYHNAQEGDGFCVSEMNVVWSKMCKLTWEQKPKTFRRSEDAGWSWLRQCYYLQWNVSCTNIYWKVIMWYGSYYSKSNIEKASYKVVTKWLQSGAKTTKSMFWPSHQKSPDLNPTQNLRADLKRCVQEASCQPLSVPAVLFGGMGHNSISLLWQAWERKPNMSKVKCWGIYVKFWFWNH